MQRAHLLLFAVLILPLLSNELDDSVIAATTRSTDFSETTGLHTLSFTPNRYLRNGDILQFTAYLHNLILRSGDLMMLNGPIRSTFGYAVMPDDVKFSTSGINHCLSFTIKVSADHGISIASIYILEKPDNTSDDKIFNWDLKSIRNDPSSPSQPDLPSLSPSPTAPEHSSPSSTSTAQPVLPSLSPSPTDKDRPSPPKSDQDHDNIDWILITPDDSVHLAPQLYGSSIDITLHTNHSLVKGEKFKVQISCSNFENFGILSELQTSLSKSSISVGKNFQQTASLKFCFPLITTI
jgi:hypothetical protein